MNSYEITHEHFLQRGQESKPKVLRVRFWLQGLGYLVTDGPEKWAARHADWQSCRDDGDLRITEGHREEEMAHPLRIEVKGMLKYSFSCMEDYPYRTALVCACHQFDGADPTPHAYITVSKDLLYGSVLLVEPTRAQWWIKETEDRDRSAKKGSPSIQTCYYTHLHHLTIVDLCNPNPLNNPLSPKRP